MCQGTWMFHLLPSCEGKHNINKIDTTEGTQYTAWEEELHQCRQCKDEMGWKVWGKGKKCWMETAKNKMWRQTRALVEMNQVRRKRSQMMQNSSPILQQCKLPTCNLQRHHCWDGKNQLQATKKTEIRVKISLNGADICWPLPLPIPYMWWPWHKPTFSGALAALPPSSQRLDGHLIHCSRTWAAAT